MEKVEFQARGSPHYHAIYWIKCTPRLGIDSDSAVTKFIDSIISTKLHGESDIELHNLVTKLQVHRCSTTYCSKWKDKKCRFGFPKLPSAEMIIARPSGDNMQILTSHQQKTFGNHLDKVKEKINSGYEKSLTDLLSEVNISAEDYTEAVKSSSTKANIILRRRPAETHVNPYNLELL